MVRPSIAERVSAEVEVLRGYLEASSRPGELLTPLSTAFIGDALDRVLKACSPRNAAVTTAGTVVEATVPVTPVKSRKQPTAAPRRRGAPQTPSGGAA